MRLVVFIILCLFSLRVEAMPLNKGENESVLHDKYDFRPLGGVEKKKQIEKESKELEGVFLSIMMEPMFPGKEGGDLYGGGTGSDVYRTLMIQEYGKVMANAGGVGLSKGIIKDMNRRQ